MIFNKILHTLINLLAQKSLQLGIRLKIGVPRFVSRHKMLFRLKSLFRWAEIFCCPMNSFSWWGCCDRRQQSCLQQIDKLLVKNFAKQKVFSSLNKNNNMSQLWPNQCLRKLCSKRSFCCFKNSSFLFLHKKMWCSFFSEQIFWSIKWLKGQLGHFSHLTF